MQRRPISNVNPRLPCDIKHMSCTRLYGPSHGWCNRLLTIPLLVNQTTAAALDFCHPMNGWYTRLLPIPRLVHQTILAIPRLLHQTTDHPTVGAPDYRPSLSWCTRLPTIPSVGPPDYILTIVIQVFAVTSPLFSSTLSTSTREKRIRTTTGSVWWRTGRTSLLYPCSSWLYSCLSCCDPPHTSSRVSNVRTMPTYDFKIRI